MRAWTEFSLRIALVLSFVIEFGILFSEGSKRSHDKKVVCYVGTWSVYRPGRGAFKIEDIAPELCTHIVYAFVGLNATTNTLRSIDPYQDLEENYGKGSFKKMTALKSKNPDLKVTLAVGGWNEGSLNYSTMAQSPDTRRKFINSVVQYVSKYNFDGFDLDWEFPGTRGGRKEDKENFVALVKELKEELKKGQWILTAALGAAPDTIESAYDVPEISKYLDLIHLMCYDYHGSWDRKVGSNAPLRSNDKLSVEHSVEHMLRLGAPPHKLVLGLPTYGHTFTVDEQVEPGMGASAMEPGLEGRFTKQKGFLGYNEICMDFEKNHWSLFWDENSTTPYAVNGQLVVSYDDERSITEKVKLGLQHDLGGFMLWSIETDDFHGDCEKEREGDTHNSNGKFPLLRAVHRAIEDYNLEVKDIDINDINNDISEGNRTRTSSGAAAVTCSLSVIFLLITAFI